MPLYKEFPNIELTPFGLKELNDVRLSVDKPNSAWVSDVTYFKYNEKWFFICVLLTYFLGK